MEFPDLGKYCSAQSCGQIDFLPMKCDACSNIFCSQHFAYRSHNCASAYKKDVQVPVCPVCSAPVPGDRDQLPDVAVSRHLDSGLCGTRLSDARQRRRVFKHRCAATGCRSRELMPLLCDACGANFCLRHRHPADHACSTAGPSKNPAGPSRNLAGAAAMNRAVQPTQMSEDEALARALANSLQDMHTHDNNNTATQPRGNNTGRCSLA